MSHGWHRDDGYWYEAPYLARNQADGVLCLDCRSMLPLGKSNDAAFTEARQRRTAP